MEPRRIALCFVLAAALVAGCARGPSYTGPRRTSGTCDGACRHYVACKSSREEGLREACMRECLEIYVDDGVADSETLRGYERLTCPAAVQFVEGASGRVPGELDNDPPVTSSARAAQD